MEPVKFNSTSDYQFMDIFGVEGVFTPLRIDADTLPDGFFKYSLRSGEEELVSQICKNVMVDHAGDFITKEKLDLGPEKNRVLEPDDWGFTDKPFTFEAYFGCNLTLDCQIQLADARRTAQLEGKQFQKGRMNPEQALL